MSSRALAELLAAVLKKDCFFRFKAKGFSMYPFIKDDDAITVSSLSKQSLCLGDIIAAYNVATDTFIVHRLIKKNVNYCVLKGDNNPEPDEKLKMTELIGRVTCIERHGKRKYFGLGSERWFIAWLNRKNFLIPILGKIRTFMKYFT